MSIWYAAHIYKKVEAAKRKSCKNQTLSDDMYLGINIYFCHRFLLSNIKIGRIELFVVVVIVIDHQQFNIHPLQKSIFFLNFT